MENGGIGRDQFLHLEAFHLKTWRVIRQAGQHLLDLPDAARRPCVIVIVMGYEQLLGKPFEFLRIERQRFDLPSAGRGRLSLRLKFGPHCTQHRSCSQTCQNFTTFHGFSFRCLIDDR